MFEWMRTANDHGVWDFISTLVLLASFGVAIKLIFFPKHRVPHLNFHIQRLRDSSNYPLKILVEIRNQTGQPCVIAFPFVKLKGLRPDPKAHGDSASGELEIKFPAPGSTNLTEIDFYLRHGEQVKTWVPLDSTHSDAEVDLELANGTVGTWECTCYWLGENPQRHKLRFSLRRIL